MGRQVAGLAPEPAEHAVLDGDGVYRTVSVFEDAERESYLRAASTLFPIDADGNTVVMHRATVYNKDALWNDVKRWFDGGSRGERRDQPPACGAEG